MFGRNLKYYRIKNGLSKAQLAKMCGLTTMAISNYENDDRKPKMNVIKDLAKALNINVSDFLKSNYLMLEVSHNEFRKTQKVSSEQKKLIFLEAENYLSRFFTAIQCIPDDVLSSPFKIHRLKPTMDIEKDQEAIRRALKMSMRGPVRNIDIVLENAGIILFNLDIDEENFSGLNGQVNKYPYIAFNKNMTYERQRFTIAHELAHIVFDMSNLNMEQKAIEKYANKVAGAFLLPKEDLLRELGRKRTRISYDMKYICKEYGVASQMLIMRAKQLGIISNSLATSYFVYLNKNGLKKSETFREDKKVKPLMFKQMVYRGVSENDISPQKGCELLDIPYKKLMKKINKDSKEMLWSV